MGESFDICCLKRVSDGTKKHKLIELEHSNEVTIGRDRDATVLIVSPDISRRHAILQKQSDNTWTITDNKSTNGVKVNGVKLLPLQPVTLHDCDRVQLGVPPGPCQAAPYLWVFCEKLRVKRKTSVRLETAADRKHPLADSQRTASQPDIPMAIPMKKKLCVSSEWSPSQDLHRKLEEEEERMREQMRRQEEKLEELQQRLEEKDLVQAAMETEIRVKEAELKEELRKQKEQLEVERRDFEAEVKRAYEAEIEAKERSLLARLEQEQEQLRSEKASVEETLQRQMEQQLHEKDNRLQVELEQQKTHLENIIAQRELEQKMLASELTKTKCESEVQRDVALQARESLLANFATLMETELQCSICNELFVQATSLNCAHSFCVACIEQWKKVKKQCPVCRCPITSQLRSLVLDSYIDRMVEHLSDDMKKSREKLIEERKAEKLVREAAAATAAATAAMSRGRGRRRGRGQGRQRGGRSMRGRNNTAAVPPQVVDPAPQVTVPVLPIVIESDASDTDWGSGEERYHGYSSSEGDSEESVEGVPGTYFGGWGHCFHCGSRGHWANGCPYR